MTESLNELRRLWRDISDLQSAASLLSWDQSTYMPRGGAPARARQLATLSRLAHEKLTSPALGALLDSLRTELTQLSPDFPEYGLIRAAAREFDLAARVPSAFVEKFSAHQAETYEIWTQARPENDFSKVLPHLEKTLDLSREYASFASGFQHIADPLIDLSDPGMKAGDIQALFSALRSELVPLVHQIRSAPPVSNECLFHPIPEDQQLAFGKKIIEAFGFDFSRGRQDKSPHPFMTKFSLGDIRITTRVKPDDLTEALFSTLHETGHAMYEQGIDPSWEGTPVAGGASSGIHESQSRLWENIVGRSEPFWTFYYPQLQRDFPAAFGSVSKQDFYRAINKVEASLIRTDADEVTYNLHVMLRFDFELALLEGKMAVRDLPEAWRARMKADLGVEPPDDRMGVLQDVHWFGGHIGGVFQGYTIGNILSAQFFAAACQAIPSIPEEIASGSFQSLHQWLKQHVYRYGSQFTPDELIIRATGQPLTIQPYLQYLRKKYGAIYSAVS